jgi:cytochrome bd-type quinol oxidase subunit 2
MPEERKKLSIYLILLLPLFIILGALIVITLEPTYEASYSSPWRQIDSTLCSGLFIGIGIITIIPLIYRQTNTLKRRFTKKEKHLILASGIAILIIGVFLLFTTFIHGMSGVVHMSPFSQLYSVCVVIFGYGLTLFGFILPIKIPETNSNTVDDKNTI